MKVANERHSKTITQRGHVQKTSVLTARLTAKQLANARLLNVYSYHTHSLFNMHNIHDLYNLGVRFICEYGYVGDAAC